MSKETKAVIVDGPWKADLCWVPPDKRCMRRGCQALVYVCEKKKTKDGQFYVLDYRFTIDAGPEVRIRRSDASGTNEYGDTQVFPYFHELGISKRALRAFIREFNWKAVYYADD